MVTGTAKIQKVKYLMGHFLEAIQAMGVWDIYDHLGYPHTKLHLILRVSYAKLW